MQQNLISKTEKVVDTSKFAKQVDLASLKSDVDDLDIDKLKAVPGDTYKVTNVIENDAIKKTVYNELVKKVYAFQTIDTGDLVKKVDYNTKIDEFERKKKPNHDEYIIT